MARAYKHTDVAVLNWAVKYLVPKSTLITLENELSISHSTLWWCFVHRLPNISTVTSQAVNVKLQNNNRRNKA